jgi:hypothetical protein
VTTTVCAATVHCPADAPGGSDSILPTSFTPESGPEAAMALAVNKKLANLKTLLVFIVRLPVL